MKKKSGCLNLLMMLLVVIVAIGLAIYLAYTCMLAPNINGLSLSELATIYSELKEPVDESEVITNPIDEEDYVSAVAKLSGASIDVFNEENANKMDADAVKSASASDLSMQLTLTDTEIASLLNEYISVANSEEFDISAFCVREIIIEEEDGVVTISVIAKLDTSAVGDEVGSLSDLLPEDIYIKTVNTLLVENEEYVLQLGNVSVLNLTDNSNKLLIGAVADVADNNSDTEIDSEYLNTLIGSKFVDFINKLKTDDGITVSFTDGNIILTPEV